MKKVYVVTGSEDGVIAVTGNLKRAIEKAKDFGYIVPYSEALKQNKVKEFCLYFSLVENCSLKIEKFIINE